MVVALPLLLATTACKPDGPKEAPVIVYGDSLSWQARDQLTFLGAASGSEVVVRAGGGFAPCDLVASVEADLAKPVKPRLIVLEFWGNNLTPCMGAIEPGTEGLALASSPYFASYRAALDTIRWAASDAGVPVAWAAAPPRHPDDIAPELNDVLEGMARNRGWRVIESGDAVADPSGHWIRYLPCNPYDHNSGSCQGGLAEVRDADRVHFAAGPTSAFPGAVRWAGAVIEGID